ncbi:MAG TPA: class I SAM-dependent rRNA methyltransferase, partial [Polyangia bacterium]
MASFFGVTLPDGVDARLRNGAPIVQLEGLPGAQGCEPGRQVKMVDPHGDFVACGIADPENGVIQVLALEAVRGFDAGFFRERLARSLNLRRTLGLTTGESAYRLVNAEGDGLPGFSVDRFGDYAVVCAPSRPLLPYARLLAEATLAADGERPVRGAVIKVRGKDAQDRSHKDEVIGDAPPEKYVVTELGAPYEVHLSGALNVGLFPDMREQRRGISRFVAGRRVLNTFAYTGALSIAAARAGADTVTSVDLSGGVLAWARENFRLSGFASGDVRFRFEVSDVRRFMQKEVERGSLYDTVLLDPPTVSAARASQWSMKRDYPQLIALAAKLLPPAGGILWVSANTRRGPSVLRHVEEGVRLSGRHGALLEVGGLPPDFPTPPGWPDSRYLEICQVFV